MEESSSTHRDLRSLSVPANRAASRDFKYYNFKYVKPGQLSAPHYASGKELGPFQVFPADLSEATVVTLDKRHLYLEAQEWPRPPTYKRSYRGWRTGYRSQRYDEKRKLAVTLARDRDGRQAVLEEEMGEEDACERGRDCELCDMARLIQEGEAAEEVERRKREGMESVLDEAVEKYQRKARRRLEQEGWDYIGSPQTHSLDLDWEGASEGWETLSMPG
jgi:hypothetical protein